MNPKFKLFLFRHSSEKGFAFPIALLAGLVMVMAGIVMVTRSQSDQSKVFAQQAKADGLSIAEVAVSEIQNLINNNRSLSTANSKCATGETECWEKLTTSPSSGSWADPENPALTQLQRDFVQNLINEQLTPQDRCPKFEEAEKQALQNKINQIETRLANDTERIDEVYNLTQTSSDELSTWNAVGQNKRSPYRYYRMVRYEYSKTRKQGTLVVDGLYRNDQLASNKQLSSSNVDNSESISRIAVTFPVQLPSLDPVLAGPIAPGLWIRDGATNDASHSIGSDGSYSGNTHFKANVAMSDVCSFPKEQQKKITDFITKTHINPYEVLPEDYSAGFVTQDVPKPPEMMDGLEDISLSSFGSSNIYNQLPDDQKNVTINHDSFKGLSKSDSEEEDDDDKDTGKDTGSSSDSLVYPRDPENDKTIAIPLNNGKTADYYVYIIDNIDLSGNQKISIPYGKKVLFLLKGNMSVKGNSSIEHDCSSVPKDTPSDVTCEPTDFIIMGYADASKNPEICLKGNAQTDAFIYAPNYQVGITGNDKNEAKYRGSVWARNWGKIASCGSSGNHIAIQQMAKYEFLPQEMIPKPEGLFINAIASWRQCSFEESIENCLNPTAPTSP